jgi:hypothetical protein
VNFGRSPILIIVALFLLLFILLPLLSKKSSTSLSDTDRAVRADQALTRVMNAETAYLKKHPSGYAGHVADLIPLAHKIAVDLTDGVVTIQLDSSGDKNYLVQVASSVVTFSRTVVDGQVVAKSCLQLKSAGKAYCTRKTSQIKKSLPAT